jgi:hypothetical protein
MSKLVEAKKEQMIAKGKDISDYMEKHNILVRGQESQEEPQEKGAGDSSIRPQPTSGVLVDN